MRIESGYSLSPREERIELRSRRVQEHISNFTRHPQSISQGIKGVLHPQFLVKKTEKGAALFLDIEGMEDKALGVLYCLQANLMHRSMAPIPKGLHHMVDSFVPKEKAIELPEVQGKFTYDQTQDLILERLGAASGLPKITRQASKDYIYFSEPEETALFAVADILVHGVKTDKKGRRVVYMMPKTEEWKHTTELIRRVNKYLDERNQLIILPLEEEKPLKPPGPIMEEKETNKLARVSKKEMGKYNDIKNVLFAAQEYTDVQIFDGEVDIRFKIPTHMLESAIQRGELLKKNIVMELMSTSDEDVDRERKTTLHTIFGAKDTERTLHSVAVYSYLTNTNPESSQRIAAWLTQAKREEIHTVAADTLTFFSELLSNEGTYMETSKALTDDLLQKQDGFPGLKKLLIERYKKIREVSPKHIARELANIPVIEMGIKLFMAKQISILGGEISAAIKGRRNALRSSHQDIDPQSSNSEQALRDDGYPLYENEPHTPIEINVSAGDPRDQDILAQVLNGLVSQELFQHLKGQTQQRVVEFLLFAGAELWSQTADSTSDFGAKVLEYTEERIGKGGNIIRSFRLPQTALGEYPDEYFLHLRSKTGMWIPVSKQPDLEYDDAFRMAYMDTPIGRLSGKKVSKKRD